MPKGATAAMTQMQEVTLFFPATQEHTLVARMTLSAVGALCGLDVDLIGDLRTAADECCECLMHQPVVVTGLTLRIIHGGGRLSASFEGTWGTEATDCASLELEITRGVLETLMPQVDIRTDEHGVCALAFSMPV